MVLFVEGKVDLLFGSAQGAGKQNPTFEGRAAHQARRACMTPACMTPDSMKE